MSVGWSNTASECRDQKLNKKSIVSKKSIDLEFFFKFYAYKHSSNHYICAGIAPKLGYCVLTAVGSIVVSKSHYS